ncbi:alpha/beta hydrolase [Mycobacterium sp. pW045]|uniref:alpha/beta hydrolase n=1 Tax=Mycobacterium sp. pW045 TaxID=3238984 RepID=UPI00351BA93D
MRLRRWSITLADRLTYSRVSRVVFTATLNVVLSNRWLLARLRPVADRAIIAASPVLPGVEVGAASAPVKGEWVRAPAAIDNDRVLLVLHGSGYLICSARTHRGFAAQLSQHSGMPALVIDYRLAPEHRFPAAEDDAMAAYRWLLSRGYDSSKVVVAGDSAGGHLAVALALRARREGLPVPAAPALFGPLVDPAYRAPMVDMRTRRQPFDPRAAARAVGLYFGDHDPEDARLCLLNADLAGLPPIQLHYGTREVMRSDAEELAARVIAAGGRCEERVWPELMHGYWLWPRDSDGSSASLISAGEFLRTAVAQADAS